MYLPELCIRRPVFTTVLTVMMVLIGAVSYSRLSLREYPNIDEPVVSVQTRYPGASPEIIESQVTQILEGSIAGIAGVDVLSSTSRSETSRITIRFRSTVDPAVATSDVRDRVSRVRGKLPDSIDEPVIQKVEADAYPILYMSFASDRMNALDITDYLNRYVVDTLRNLDGVADVTIFGERKYAMRVWIDEMRLAAYRLTVQDVESALRNQNLEVPAGRIESRDREFTVLSRTGLTTPEAFSRIVLRQTGGSLIRLGDVARVEIGAADVRRTNSYNGRDAVTVGIIKQATANPLDVSKQVQKRLDQMVKELPAGMTGEMAYDSSVFIDRSIQSVFATIGEAVVFVVIVIFFFLRSWRATLIPIITIPVSLIATLALMAALGFTINTLTLLSMVLAIGLVVDDAIVVLENVHRRMEDGEGPVEAAIAGTREIAFAVIAMTITLAAVYTPLVFTTGRVGRLFIEFALTLAGAVMISGFVALTLSPMMCSKLLKEHEHHGVVFRVLEGFFNGLAAGYRGLLKATLRAWPLVVVLWVIVAIAGWKNFEGLRSELAPVEDRGTIQASGTAPEGSTIDFVSRYAALAEQVCRGLPDVRASFVLGGFPDVTNASVQCRLKDWDERSRSQQDLVASVLPAFQRIPGVSFFPNNPPSLGQSGQSRPIEFVVQTSGTYEELRKSVDKLLDRVRSNPGFVNPDTDLKLNQPQLEVTLNRDKVLDSGLQIDQVGRTLETMLGGRTIGSFERDGEQYDVIAQLAPSNRSTPQALQSIYVRGAGDAMIQLSNVVDVRETVAARSLNRFNQMRAATITANLAPGYTQGDGLAFLDKAAAEVLPPSDRTDLSGSSREFRSASSNFAFVMGLAVVFIFLVLAAQFESFVDPFVILLSVPLSMAGAMYLLQLHGGTFNVYSQIGLVTLVGLITKHGIMIVEFANQLQEHGKAKRDAIVESAVLRLRPILMTTGAMVLGAVPLALAHGAGAESRREIGWVIVGGMSFGTLLTLLVVPTFYLLLARDRHGHSVADLPVDAHRPHPAE